MIYARRVLRNVTSNWAGLLVNLVVSLFLAPFVVHSLGNMWYGVWVIMVQFTSYLYLMDFGVRDSIIRYTSKHAARGETGELNDVLNAALTIYGVIAAACLTVAGIGALFVGDLFTIADEATPAARWVIMVIGAAIAASFVFNVFTGALLGFQRYDITNGLGILTSLVRAALIVYFLSHGHGIITLGIVQLVTTASFGIGAHVLARMQLRRNGIRYKWRWVEWQRQWRIQKDLFNYSFFVLVNNLSQRIIFSTDVLIIGIFMPAASVTFYAIAGNLIEYLRQFSRAAANVLIPLTSELSARDESQRVQETLRQGSKMAMLVGLPIVVAYLLVGRRFIGLWMGSEYMAMSGDVLVLLGLAQLLSSPHYAIQSLLYGVSRHNIIAGMRVVEAVANVALSVVLVQSMGILGVALGTVIPHVITMVIVMPIVAARVFRIGLGGYVVAAYVAPLAATIPYGAMCFWMDRMWPAGSLPEFFVQIALALPLYAAGVWVIALNRAEREYIVAMIKPVVARLGRS